MGSSPTSAGDIFSYLKRTKKHATGNSESFSLSSHYVSKRLQYRDGTRINVLTRKARISSDVTNTDCYLLRRSRTVLRPNEIQRSLLFAKLSRLSSLRKPRPQQVAAPGCCNLSTLYTREECTIKIQYKREINIYSLYKAYEINIYLASLCTLWIRDCAATHNRERAYSRVQSGCRFSRYL